MTEFPRNPLGSPFMNRLRMHAAHAQWWLQTQTLPRAKRLTDIVLVVPVLLMSLPLLVLVALAIKLSDGGPILFWQQRVGQRGRLFAFPKFRSMVVDAEAVRERLAASNQHGEQGVTFKMRRDPRVTRIGRLIRRTSIDELPQLWCVLRGDMSLVGPRPPLVKEVERYTLADRQRLSAVPGLTCIWQVSGRSEVPFPEQVRMDVAYITRHSFWMDIRLLLVTLPAVIRGRGAY